MQEFHELIKNFDKIRDYMRQFYVYGFKVRSDFDAKSARTYDNERRRIESWLGDYTRSCYTAKGKHLYISVDGKSIPRNPLYAAWKSKTFTDNDLLLHFFLTDLLTENEQGMTAGELCDSIVASYGCVFDSQTIRLKLKEYESLGLLFSEKKGKALYYRLAPDLPCEKGAAAGEADPSHGLWERILTAVKFFQEAVPFGFVGSTILDRSGARNTLFQWKHHFIVHTLEDGILSDALSAIRQKRAVRLENKSSRSGKLTVMEGIPLKIMVSTRTGRRYLCLYQEESRRFNTLRLDCITKIQLLQECPFYEELSLKLKRNLPHCWGVSFGSSRSRLEEICMKLYIDEKKEPYILNRLYREGRGGEVLRIRENEYLYSGFFFDTNEMLSWVKTFTGRVMDIQCSNQAAVSKVTGDWERMYHMYCDTDMEIPEKNISGEPDDRERK